MDKVILWLVPTESMPEFPGVRCSTFVPARHRHCTLRYGVEYSEIAHLVGRKVTLRILSNHWDDRIQAVRVALPPQVACCNEVPHVTVGHLEEIEPVESNALFKRPHHYEGRAPFWFESRWQYGFRWIDD